MKVGIVTLHNALNAGAVLQAYALQTFLSQLGHQIEFINYNPIRKYSFRDYIAKSPLVMFNKWRNIFYGKRYSKQSNFNKVLSLSSKTYMSYEDLVSRPMDYDLYIAGSDQIWNFYTSLSPIYLLDFVPTNKKKIAYAASMGQCRIDKSLYTAFKDKLMRFEAISLREKNGVDFANSLLKGEKQAIQAVDPTLLNDASIYDQIIEKIETGNKPYICTYILAELDQENADIISYIKTKIGLDILNIRNPDTCIHLHKAKNKIVTPYQWLYAVKNSEFVICSSFHAVVFSLIFHKPFVALVPPDHKNKGGNMRINTLLGDVGLLNRIIPHFDTEKINQTINSPINWDEIDRRIKCLRKPSINFLKSNLN